MNDSVEYEKFDGPLDQAWHYVETRILMFAVGFTGIYITKSMLPPRWFAGDLGFGGVGLIIIMGFGALITAVIYNHSIYKIGRYHWLPRLLIDAGIVLFCAIKIYYW